MNKKKVDIDLEGVPKTLLLPLLGRAKFSQFPNPPIYDEQALKLIEILNYDFDELFRETGYSASMWWIARAYQFDVAIKHYLKKHPDAVIVNLGAGLDTTFYRVDNGRLTWVDLDLPEVILLRKKLLPAVERVQCINKSLFDLSWMSDLKQLGDKFFFVAGGLFMYFTEEQVKSLLLTMAREFSQAELVFDAIPKGGIKHANKMLDKTKMSQAILKWGLDNGRDIEKWSPDIKFVSQITYFNAIKSKYYFPYFIRLQMFFYDLFEKGGIIHLKFR